MSDAIYQQYQTKVYKDPSIWYNILRSTRRIAPWQCPETKVVLKMYKKLTKELIEADYDRQTKILSIMAEMPESDLSAKSPILGVSLDKYVRTQRKS